MKQKEYKNFRKRYDKFKQNNLPTPFWDDERQTFEYVYYDPNIILSPKHDSINNKIMVRSSLINALEDICITSFYYSYNCKLITWKDGIASIEIGHTHAHSFEEVVHDLYYFPESFSISKEEEKYFSEQELSYLRKVQNYLLLIGLKDSDDSRPKVSRYRNKLHKKYSNIPKYKLPSHIIKGLLAGKINFVVDKFYKNEYLNKNCSALICNENYEFKLYIKIYNQEIKKYKEIKNIWLDNKFDDNDMLVISYFEVLKHF